ncbi:MAG TPA: hypothetical protein VHB45_12880 [Alloacidobacterium sp.]|nr:hypothetical protein [Alloacidobacterium sp.]
MREQLAKICGVYGASLSSSLLGIADPDGKPLDGARLLWAISGCESSFGANLKPRHEPAYDVGGEYSTHPPMPELLEKFGSAAACSYGPWQILFVNAPEGFRPSDFDDLQFAAQATTAFLGKLLRACRPTTLAEIASCWNAGHVQNPLSPGVARYAADLTRYYAEPLPAAS